MVWIVGVARDILCIRECNFPHFLQPFCPIPLGISARNYGLYPIDLR